jgi:hypothetical protein
MKALFSILIALFAFTANAQQYPRMVETGQHISADEPLVIMDIDTYADYYYASAILDTLVNKYPALYLSIENVDQSYQSVEAKSDSLVKTLTRLNQERQQFITDQQLIQSKLQQSLDQATRSKKRLKVVGVLAGGLGLICGILIAR